MLAGDVSNPGLDPSASPKTSSTFWSFRRTSLSGAVQTRTVLRKVELVNSLQSSISLPCTAIFTSLDHHHYGSFEEVEDTTLYFETLSFADITACISGPVISLSNSISKFQAAEITDSHLISLDIVPVPFIDSLRSSPSIDQVSSSLSFQVSGEPVPCIPSIISSVERACDGTSGQLLPRAIGSYKIIGTLGNGTHGEVVLAHSKERNNGDFYAIKMLRDAKERDVVREISTLQLIREWSGSPSVYDPGVRFLQRLLEAFKDEEHVQFLVLEYHPTTLSDPEIASRFRMTNDKHSELSTSVSLPVVFDLCLLSKRPLEETVQSVRFLIAEISLGLAFLHARGLIHQDIKPANILLSNTGHVVIGDFGATSKMPLASDKHDGLPSERCHYGPIVLDSDDFVTFTPLYAAPEMKERTSNGQVIYDHRSDWWSLGILLYELITGTFPFQGLACAELTLNGRRSDGDHSLSFGELEIMSDRLKEKNIIWYPGLDNFLRSLLSHNPEDRLSWPDVKEHEFLSPLSGLWEDISDLKYSPCPKPPISGFHNETFSPMADHIVVHGVKSIPATLYSQDDFLYGLPGTAHKASFESDDIFQPSSSLPLSLMATWELQQPPGIHDSDSDGGSIPQALPSSASIWAYGHTRDTSISESELHDSGCDVCSHVVDASSTTDKLKYTVATPYVPSLFSSTPVLDFEFEQHLDLRSPYSPVAQNVDSESPAVCGDLIALEDITWSLLEAMDYRDQLLCEGKRGRRTSVRKAVLGAFKRILRKLFTK